MRELYVRQHSGVSAGENSTHICRWYCKPLILWNNRYIYQGHMRKEECLALWAWQRSTYLPALLTTRQAAPERFATPKIATVLNLTVVGKFLGRGICVPAALRPFWPTVPVTAGVGQNIGAVWSLRQVQR